MACERLLSRLACKPEVRAMIPMVATSIVPHLGRLACAYFHSSAHPPDNLGGKSVDRLGMSPILILSLSVEIRIDTPMDSCRQKSKRIAHRCPAAAYMGKPETRPLFHEPILGPRSINSHISLQPRQNDKPSQTRKSRPKQGSQTLLRISSAPARGTEPLQF